MKIRLTEAQHEATLINSTPPTLPFSDQYFDAVIAINYLEISPSPLTMLREIKRVLAPNGRAVISVFNKYGPWCIPAIPRLLNQSVNDEAPVFFTKQDFNFILEATGLRVEHLKEAACYLPIALPIKIKLPAAGAYIGLIDHAPKTPDTTAAPE
jgi:ubiquinone/menaquinone biosynthesis C-methylase UbiE